MKYVMSWDECHDACKEWMEKKLDYAALEGGCFFVESASGQVEIEDLQFHCIDYPAPQEDQL